MKITYLCILLLIVLIACSNNPVNNADSLNPGRRDYEWTIDTLKASPGNLYYLWNMWGSSPENIWTVGSGDADYTVWHYDGQKWQTYPRWVSGNLSGIYGFRSDDVWACDNGGNIFHYNGSGWSKINNFQVLGFTGVTFNDIWGESSTKIFAVGSASTEDTYIAKGIILEYDGNAGSFVELPDLPITFGWIRKGENENYFLSSLKVGGGVVPDTNKIFLYNSTGLKELWSGTGVSTVNDMNNEIYIAIGKQIYKYKNNKLQIWKDFSSTTYIGRLWGRSESDFFGVASNGLAHYNGTDLVTLYPTDLFINEVLVFEKEIVISAENNIVIHGKLKD